MRRIKPPTDDEFEELLNPPDPNRELRLKVGEIIRHKKNPTLVGKITEIRWDMIIGVFPEGKPFTWLIGQVERVV